MAEQITISTEWLRLIPFGLMIAAVIWNLSLAVRSKRFIKKLESECEELSKELARLLATRDVLNRIATHSQIEQINKELYKLHMPPEIKKHLYPVAKLVPLTNIPTADK